MNKRLGKIFHKIGNIAQKGSGKWVLTGVAVALQGRWWDAKINFSREKFMKRSRAALKTHLASLRPMHPFIGIS